MARASGIALLSLIMAFAAGGLQADVLNLADGSRIVGTIERLDGAEATLSGTFAGELKVPRGTIVSIETDQPVTVQLESPESALRSFVRGRASLRSVLGEL